eukprot:355321-Chlamydomonas_euryale.AAC.2
MHDALLLQAQAALTSSVEESNVTRDESMKLSTEIGALRSQLQAALASAEQANALQDQLVEFQQQVHSSQGLADLLQVEVDELKAKLASQTPIIAHARLDNQVRALSDDLQAANERAAFAEREAAKYQRTAASAETAWLEMRRLTDENQCIVAGMVKMQENIKWPVVLTTVPYQRWHYLPIKKFYVRVRTCIGMCRSGSGSPLWRVAVQTGAGRVRPPRSHVHTGDVCGEGTCGG